jgi:hypothetical protein
LQKSQIPHYASDTMDQNAKFASTGDTMALSPSFEQRWTIF